MARDMRDEWSVCDRVITRDAPLSDGTPRFERGYRSRIMLVHKTRNWRGLPMTRAKMLVVSPLFSRHDEAKKWDWAEAFENA